MQEATFHELADLALKSTGQSIPVAKAYLVEARIAHILRREGFAGADDLVACMKARPNPSFEAEILAALQSRETWFFRDRDRLHRLVSGILPERLRHSKAGRIRIWCAGVSTGQEAYSLAMLLKEADTPALKGAKIDITGTDICRKSLDQARAGLYGHFEVQNGLSVHRLLANFERLETGHWQVSEELRERIGFRHHNLVDANTNLGQFDIILCRNVISGMDPSRRRTVCESLADQLTPGGIVLLGERETLSAQKDCALEPSRQMGGAFSAVDKDRRTRAA